MVHWYFEIDLFIECFLSYYMWASWHWNIFNIVGLCTSGFRRSQDDTCLTHWDRETHICVGKLSIIASDNGLSPGRRQANIWTNAGLLLIGTLGTNFIKILIDSHTFSFKKMHLKMSSWKWRPFCLGLNVLKRQLMKTLLQFNVMSWQYTLIDMITHTDGIVEMWGHDTTL